MQTAALATFAETEAASHFPTGWGVDLRSQPSISHHSVTLPLVRKAPDAITADDLHDEMHDQRTDVRSDVVRMLSRYVLLSGESSMRSIAGRIAIDETRVGRQRPGSELVAELEGLSYVEALDAFARAYLRKALYAQPELPQHLVDDEGRPRPRTMPRRDAVQIVRGRPSRHAASGNSARDFTATVAMKLARLPRSSEVAVVRAEQIKLERVVLGNQLQRCRSEHGRLAGGGKNAKRLRAEKGAEIATLRAREEAFDIELRSLTRTLVYRRGLELLAVYCTEAADVEAICFGLR